MFGESKTYAKKEWYEEVDPDSYYEKKYEETLAKFLPEIYPDYITLPFSQDIKCSNTGVKKKPDLVMIRNDYKEWFIVEAEMSRHDWDGHVEPQVRVFKNGIYKKEVVAPYVKSKDILNQLDLTGLSIMIEEYPPRVIIFVNDELTGWKKKAKKLGVLLSVFQIYKGTNGLEAYRISGDSPYIYRDDSHCMFIKSLGNTMKVLNPTFIVESSEEIIEIIFRKKIYKWKVNRSKDELYLIYLGATNNFQIDKSYVLYKSPQNKYFLEIN